MLEGMTVEEKRKLGLSRARDYTYLTIVSLLGEINSVLLSIVVFCREMDLCLCDFRVTAQSVTAETTRTSTPTSAPP